MLSTLIKLFILLVTIIISMKYLGKFIYLISTGELHKHNPKLRKLEHTALKTLGIDQSPNTHSSYFYSLFSFSILTLLGIALCLYFQHLLPLNPQQFAGLSVVKSFHIAANYITGTNLQNYAGESTLSHLSQTALTIGEFASSTCGICAAFAMVRGFIPHDESEAGTAGNFSVDFFRISVYLMLPICFVFSLLLAYFGVIDSYAPHIKFTTIEGLIQTIPTGPVAAQESIKFLGVNGGGFFGANSAHPFENPTPFTNFLQVYAMLLIPSSLIYYYGLMVKNRKHARLLFHFMITLLFISSIATVYFDTALSTISMEGKEVRFGILDSIIFSTIASGTSGASNSSYADYSIYSTLRLLINILSGSALIGGIGTGLLNITIFVILAVFISGQISGRTPQFLGKKIGYHEIKFIIFYLLLYQSVILLFSSYYLYDSSLALHHDEKNYFEITKVLYAYASATVNNGTGFGSFADDPKLDVTLACAMLIGKFGIFATMLGVADSLAKKRTTQNHLDEVQIDTPFFAFLILFMMINDILVFIPSAILGPGLQILSQ